MLQGNKSKWIFWMGCLVLGAALLLPEVILRAEPDNDLDRAMQAFTQAIRSRDNQGVLGAFSSSNPFRYVQYEFATGNQVFQETVDYGKVARDFKARKGWYEFFLIDTTEGTERPLASRTPKKWYRQGATFVVYPDNPKGFYIKWRQEGNKWVIAEIGESRD